MPITLTAERVAAEVRAEMARQGKRQTDLAELLGTSQAAVSRRLKGDVDFTTTELMKVSDYLGVSVTQFLPAQDGAA